MTPMTPMITPATLAYTFFSLMIAAALLFGTYYRIKERDLEQTLLYGLPAGFVLSLWVVLFFG